MPAASKANPAAVPAAAPATFLPLPLLVALFCVLWSSAFAGAKLALADCPPLILLSVRLLLAGSIMLALAPQTVRMELAQPEYPEFPELFGSEPVPLNTFNASGVFGDPRPATAEKGEAMIAGIAAESLRLIELWRSKHAI